MAEKRKDLTSKQIKLIAALLEYKTKQAAAQSIGISQTTLYKWFADPVFVNAYRLAVDKFLDENICQLQTRTDKALQTFVEIMENPEAGVMARLNAAHAIYTYSLKCKDLAISAKLDELERIVKTGGAGAEVISYEE